MSITATRQSELVTRGDASALAKRLAIPAVLAGIAGGLVMIVVMILVMGTSGMGYASPLNLGMASFVVTIAPPLAMLPMLMPAMGINLPPQMMGQLAPALISGHVPAPMMDKVGPMLTSMHVPAAKVHMISQMMSGHASNATVAKMMGQLPPQVRHKVMAAMPVSTSHVAVGSILHFSFAVFLGIAFFALITSAAWKMPVFRSPMALMGVGMIGGVVVYAINRWVLLPTVNPMMSLVPQIAFFITHLLFGLIVGTMLAMQLRRESVSALLPSVA